MKKLILTFMGFIGLFTISSCTKQPTACLDYEDRTYIVGEEVAFDSNCSEETDRYKWDYQYNVVSTGGVGAFDNENGSSFSYTF